MSKRNELRDNIYQRMHGFKTVKRGYRKDGQSKWYYIDPRGAHSVEDMKEIDVPSENAPNPKLNDILADDMQKNPQDYYIWRTVGDDKVRSAHAEREGEIFNWHVPPEGGHPGEDYNCRCWAEPYKPERYADKPMIVDVSGILPKKVGTNKKLPEGSYTTEQGNMTTDIPVQFLKLPETEKSDNQAHNVPLVPIPTPKPKKTESQTTANKIVPVPTRKPLPANATLEQMLQRYILEYSPNLKQNLAPLNDTNSYTTELGNMALDVPIQFIKNVENYEYAHRKYEFTNSKEEKLLKRVAKQIVGEESYKDFSYLDSSGFITVGKGQLIHDWNTFNAVHWLIDERPATEDEKRKAYKIMLDKRTQLIIEEKNAAIKENRRERNPFNKIADYYAGLTRIYITEDEADYWMYSHLHNDYINLKKYLPEIDSAPEAAQDVAFDIQYNPGITSTTWTNFKKYFNERNTKELSKQVHRNGISESRNNRMRDKILSIKKW